MNVVNYESPTANRFGCEPCAMCASPLTRALYRGKGQLQVECTECGFFVDARFADEEGAPDRATRTLFADPEPAVLHPTDGHSGDHVAAGLTSVVERWPSEALSGPPTCSICRRSHGPETRHEVE